MTSDSKPKFCYNCGSSVQQNHKFCSSCGNNLEAGNSPSQKQRIKYSGRQILLISVGSIALLSVCYVLNPWFIGKAPTQTAASAKTSSGNINSHTGVASSNEIFEAIDSLSAILKSNPQDTDALLQMAEISFEQKMFEKASDFYKRYLEIKSEDLLVRTRYASSLTFNGKSEEAVKELNAVLAKSPDNFQALAFSAIAYSEIGQQDKAKELLAKAISLAPNDEARARLNRFGESMDAPDATESGTDSLEGYLKNHQIAGPKFRGISAEGNNIYLDFADFPMDQMPPVVKDKFTGNVLQQASEVAAYKGKKILFRDIGSSVIMAEVIIP